jgi:hypothetical protein
MEYEPILALFQGFEPFLEARSGTICQCQPQNGIVSGFSMTIRSQDPNGMNTLDLIFENLVSVL